MLAKSLGMNMERVLPARGPPKAVAGIFIAARVLRPEGLAAVRAARANRLQTSLNSALGSALASIGLTIPAGAVDFTKATDARRRSRGLDLTSTWA